MATGWGFGEWGFSPWGGASPINLACVPAGPQMQITIHSPGPAEQNVLPDRIVKIAFYDSTFNLDITTAYITFNGVAAYNGTNFLNGFYGTTNYFNGLFTIQILSPYGWDYDSAYSTFAKIKNTSGECLEDTWIWYTASDPACYSGLTPVPVESLIQQPLDRLLAAEQLRTLLFVNVLRTTNKAVNNGPNKAARVIYQTACATELSALLNQYVARDAPALKTNVCERENSVIVDNKIMPYKDIIIQAIDALQLKAFITREYVNTLHDYLNSTNYNLRVSLMCNLVILSKLLEYKKLA